MNSKIDGPIVLLKSSCRFLTDNWKVLIPIIALPTIIFYCSEILVYFGVFGVIVGLIFKLIGGILYVAMLPALISTIKSLENGSVPTLKESYKIGLGFFGPYIFILIINFFIGMGSFVLLIIPGIILSVYTSLYVYTLVLDGKEGFSSLIESYTLVRGRWWAFVGRFLFLGLIMLGLGIIFIGLTFLFGFSSNEIMTQASEQVFSTKTFLRLTIDYTASIIASALSGLYIYHLYSSLKKTRTAVVAGNFKKWLVTFMVIGIIGVPVIGIFMTLAVLKYAPSFLEQNSNFQQMMEDNSSLQESFGTIPE